LVSTSLRPGVSRTGIAFQFSLQAKSWSRMQPINHGLAAMLLVSSNIVEKEEDLKAALDVPSVFTWIA